jgi:hypothetical protein
MLYARKVLQIPTSTPIAIAFFPCPRAHPMLIMDFAPAHDSRFAGFIPIVEILSGRG